MKKVVAIVLSVLLMLSLVACGSSAPEGGNGGTSGGDGKKTIGVILPTQELARCLKDEEYLGEALSALGYNTDIQFSKGESATEIQMIETFILRGYDGIIVSPNDGGALVSAVEKCHDAGIPIIAYDALILNTPYINYYAADDLRGIGALQAQYIVDTLDLDHAAGDFTIELFAGDFADPNAAYFYEGAYNVLKPYLDNGKLVCLSGQVDFKVCGLSWAGDKAQARMDALLSTYYQDRRIDACLTQNDDVAGGVISALKSAGYGTADKPLPLTTGQDCTIAALKSIHSGEQSMTVYKDIRTLAKNAAYIIDCLVKGEEPKLDDYTTYDNGANEVIASCVEPIALTKDNLEELILGNNFYTKEELGF